MKIKLFGKELFEYKKSGSELFWADSNNAIKDSPILFDFFKLFSDRSWEVKAEVVTEMEYNIRTNKKLKKLPPKKESTITPKDVYNLKLLNDQSFRMKTDKDYIEKQLTEFKEKLGFIQREKNDYSNGVQEIASVIMRLENRKNYPKFQKFFEQFPYTSTTKISDLLKKHTNLNMKVVAEFVADLPPEAVKVMKDYDNNVEKLCKKKSIFYIIANSNDFKKTERRRDPILLAQSPFGHFWQILGAWDEEMILLEEL